MKFNLSGGLRAECKWLSTACIAQACNAAHALDRLQPEHASRILSTILQMKAQGKRSHKRHLLRRSANPDVTERSTGDHDRGLQSEASHSWLPLPAFQLAEVRDWMPPSSCPVLVVAMACLRQHDMHAQKADSRPCSSVHVLSSLQACSCHA